MPSPPSPDSALHGASRHFSIPATLAAHDDASGFTCFRGKDERSEARLTETGVPAVPSLRGFRRIINLDSCFSLGILKSFSKVNRRSSVVMIAVTAPGRTSSARSSVSAFIQLFSSVSNCNRRRYVFRMRSHHLGTYHSVPIHTSSSCEFSFLLPIDHLQLLLNSLSRPVIHRVHALGSIPNDALSSLDGLGSLVKRSLDEGTENVSLDRDLVLLCRGERSRAGELGESSR